MKKIKFDITKRPKTDAEHVAYLVDKENVDIMRQYVDKYYRTSSGYFKSWPKWFDEIIADKIIQNPSSTYYLYFGNKQSICWDEGYIDVAERYGYEIYYVVSIPEIITME